MSGIGIIHNPFAKGNLKRPYIANQLRKILGSHGEVYETKNIDMLPEVAEEFLKDEIEILAVNGGDGTVGLALTAFVHVYGNRPLPMLLSLRGGTMNTMSNSLGLKGKTKPILRRAVDIYRRGEKFETMSQHLVRVNDMYGTLTGGGLASNFLDAYYSGSGTGPAEAAKVVTKTIASTMARTQYSKKLFAPTRAKIIVDGELVPLNDFTVILGCSVVEIGLGFKPTPRAYDDMGKFHFIATSVKPIKVIPKIPTLYRGKDLIRPDVFSKPAKKVIIEPESSLRYMIDGELYDYDKPLELETGPTIQVIKI